MKAPTLLILSFVALILRQSAPAFPAEPNPTADHKLDQFSDPLPLGAIVRLGTTRLRNAQGVEGVAFSPDGKTLVSCGRDNSIRFWDIATSAPTKRLVCDDGDGTLGVAFSKDGGKLASVSERGFVRMWDVASGRQLWKVLGHLELAALPRQFGTRIYGVAFSPDGNTLATGGDDPTIKLWDVATGKKLREFDTHREGGDARPVAFSPDGKLLASANTMGAIFAWNVADGKLTYGIKKAHQCGIASLLFTPDGKELISAGCHFESTGKHSGNMISEIKAWDAATGESRPDFPTASDLSGEVTLALSPDGRKMYSAHYDQVIFWDVDSRSPTHYLRIERAQLGGRTHGLAISPSGKLLASKAHWNRHDKVWLYDLEHQEELFPQEEAHAYSVLAVRYSPDGSQIATGSGDNTVRLWDAHTGKHLRLVDEGSGWVRYVQFTPNGKQLLLGRETHSPPDSEFRGELKVYNVDDGKLLATMAAPDRVMSGALSPDGKTVAAAVGLEGPIGQNPFGGGNISPKVMIWEIPSGQQLAALDARAAQGTLAFSAEGDELSYISSGLEAQRWHWRDGTEIPVKLPVQNAGRGHYKTAFSPSAAICVFGGSARVDQKKLIGSLSVIDLQHANELWSQTFDNSRPWELAISADNRLLATYFMPLSTAKVGSRLTIWSAHDGKELLTFNIPDDAVRSLAFAPDNARLISGMELGDALVWDISPALAKLK